MEAEPEDVSGLPLKSLTETEAAPLFISAEAARMKAPTRMRPAMPAACTCAVTASRRRAFPVHKDEGRGRRAITRQRASTSVGRFSRTKSVRRKGLFPFSGELNKIRLNQVDLVNGHDVENDANRGGFRRAGNDRILSALRVWP